MLINGHTLFLVVMVFAIISMFLENSKNDRAEYWDKVWKKIIEKEDDANG